MFDVISTLIEGKSLALPSFLILMMIFIYLLYRIIRNLSPRPIMTETEEFQKLLSIAGYSFDSTQDIFYSKMNAWQRKYGYCRLYDEAAAPAGIIVDSEPVRFEYGGKRWLIELWKGQYHLNTGGEIGVYYTEEPDLSVPGLFNGAFYKCVDNANRLDMAFILYKNGKELFRREAKHWWLAGFKPGEFSEPGELTMRIRITFKDAQMCRSFLKAMKRIGYRDQDIVTDEITAEFTFDDTHTPQPLTRTEETDWIIQRNNERVCGLYQDITGEFAAWPEKLKSIQVKEPLLYMAILNVGKTKQIFSAFEKLKNYL